MYNRLEEVKEQILNNLKQVKRDGIENLINWLVESDFFTAPASAKFHSNCEGGLAVHSLKVSKLFNMFNNNLKRDIPKDAILLAGLLHDICKVRFYTTEERNRKVDGKWEKYSAYKIEDSEPLGHGSKSVILLNKFIKLTEYETYAILWHMGLPESYGDRLSYNEALKKHPNILLLHVADNISSNMYEKIFN